MSDETTLCQCGLRQFDPEVTDCQVPACRHKNRPKPKTWAVSFDRDDAYYQHMAEQMMWGSDE